MFTAAVKQYADWILNEIDPKKYISRRLYRGSCTVRRGVYLKDLSKVKRDLKRTVIVDNIPENFALQKDNGIGIKTWFSNHSSDTEIFKLHTVLDELRQLDDVRVGIRKIKGSLNKDSRFN